MNDDERSELLAQLAACQEQLAGYIEVVTDVVERLGHEGSEPGDLLDALGEIEGMLAGKITSEPHDLAGLAEVCRQALWHRDRARLLLADARETCDRRAAERDAAILERDAAIRELARLLAARETCPKSNDSQLAVPNTAQERVKDYCPVLKHCADIIHCAELGYCPHLETE